MLRKINQLKVYLMNSFLLSFRNMSRQRSRSFLTALSIFVAAFVICLCDGWMKGVVDAQLNDFSLYQTGHVRVTTKDYKKRERFLPVDEYFNDTVKQRISEIEGVKSVESRVRFGLLLSVNEKTVMATGVGLDNNTNIPIGEKIIEGKADLKGIVIGKGLAEKCNVKVGDNLMVVTKTSEGGMNALKKPITGIMELNIAMYDNNMFITGKKNINRLLKLEEGHTELYIYLKESSEERILNILPKIKSILPSELEAYSLMEQLGGLYDWIEGASDIFLVFEILIMLLASLVIMNSMYMSILERKREIGLMKALGFTNTELFLNFTIEGGLTGIIGGIPGLLGGYWLVYYFHEKGLNLKDLFQEIEMPLNYILYPTISTEILITTTILVIFIPSIVAMLPARSVLRLQASEALKK